MRCSDCVPVPPRYRRGGWSPDRCESCPAQSHLPRRESAPAAGTPPRPPGRRAGPLPEFRPTPTPPADCETSPRWERWAHRAAPGRNRLRRVHRPPSTPSPRPARRAPAAGSRCVSSACACGASTGQACSNPGKRPSQIVGVERLARDMPASAFVRQRPGRSASCGLRLAVSGGRTSPAESAPPPTGTPRCRDDRSSGAEPRRWRAAPRVPRTRPTRVPSAHLRPHRRGPGVAATPPYAMRQCATRPARSSVTA